MRNPFTILFLILAGAFIFTWTSWINDHSYATTQSGPTGAWFIEKGVANGDGDWQYLAGEYACRIYGTFDSATVDVETFIDGTTAAPVDIFDIGAAGLVGVTVDSGWVDLRARSAYYRIEVTGGLGSESINWHCGRILS
jgi:hypothetical protein